MLNCHTLQCIVKHFRSFLFKIYIYSATHSGALCHCIFHFSDNRNGAFCSPAGFQENFSQRNCHNSKFIYIFGLGTISWVRGNKSTSNGFDNVLQKRNTSQSQRVPEWSQQVPKWSLGVPLWSHWQIVDLPKLHCGAAPQSVMCNIPLCDGIRDQVQFQK